ncbi:hypothetical protein SNE25_08455 [Mucilaginibacter sabulilitoris]|uniref:Uncharacterized protein n=1 Tax=Mucilaginibacter sabulilitoris TaxID=1173583 RepID=A0ABZ0TR05_9SPHI|nr:hypothetical protein [Mucilaginibacter sabulilitoris]WPU95552.1 hypothetical protein SNE25_08455 [Mucilaginibacter sabulilitoris]
MPADVGHIKNNYDVVSTSYDFTNQPDSTTGDKRYQDKTHLPNVNTKAPLVSDVKQINAIP